MDLFISGPATSVLFVLILVCDSQLHSPDRKNLKPAVKEFDWMLLKILLKSIKSHWLRAAIVIYFTRMHVDLLQNCILRNQRYIPKLPCTPVVSILYPTQEKPLKTSTLALNLLTLFYCFAWQLESYGPWLVVS